MTLPAELRAERDRRIAFAPTGAIEVIASYHHDEPTRALLHRAADALEWRSIESAPRDGTWILAVVSPFVPAVAKWRVERGSFEYIAADNFSSDEQYKEWLMATDPWAPTHWLPLPATPEEVSPQPHCRNR